MAGKLVGQPRRTGAPPSVEKVRGQDRYRVRLAGSFEVDGADVEDLRELLRLLSVFTSVDAPRYLLPSAD